MRVKPWIWIASGSVVVWILLVLLFLPLAIGDAHAQGYSSQEARQTRALEKIGFELEQLRRCQCRHP